MSTPTEYLIVTRKTRGTSSADPSQLAAAWSALKSQISDNPDLTYVSGDFERSVVVRCTEELADSIRADLGDFLIVERNQDLRMF